MVEDGDAVVRIARTFALVIILVAANLATSASPSLAAGVCGGTNKSWFDGYQQYGHPEHVYEGASAYMIVEDGTNCVSPPPMTTTFVSSWVMIAGSTFKGYAQVGFFRAAGDTLRWFSEFNDGINPRVRTLSPYPVVNQIDVRHTFRVLYNGTCQCIKSTIDTTNFGNSTFNPFMEGNWGTFPWSPQFNSESYWKQSDITGSSTQPTVWSGMGAQRYSDDTLESIPCGILTGDDQNPTPWGIHSFSCTSFETWTR